MTARSWSDPRYAAAARLVTRQAGLTLKAVRRPAVESGIRRAMEQADIADIGEYINLLEAEPMALDDLVTELTVGQTYFFREPGHYEFLRREVLPDIRRRRGSGHALRAWSAGCSTGEEAYSLAIVLEEEGLSEQAYLLGTDISRRALQAARLARYRQWSFRGADDTVPRTYFRRISDTELERRDQFELAARFRRRVHFEYLNLALDSYPSLGTGTWGMDIIFCRNVLIYFDPDTARQVVRRLRRCLAEGGWLFRGSSDPPIAGDARLEQVVTKWGVFYRRDDAAVSVSPGWSAEATAPGPAVRTVAAVVASVEESPRPLEMPAPPAAEPPIVQPVAPATDALGEAAAALSRGEYPRAVELAQDIPEHAAASVLHVRALANIEVASAERVCAEAVGRHPLSIELHHLHAALLLGLGRYADAARAVRRVVYLDPSLAIGHFILGTILRRCGSLPGARRAYRNVRDLCAARPADEPVPLSEGEPAGRLRDVVAVELDMLGAASAPRSVGFGRGLTRADLPIVALTAHALGEQRERCEAAGMTSFLSKPFQAVDLYRIVQGWDDRLRDD